MHAILLDTDPVVTAWVQAACASAHVTLALVGSSATLERAAQQAEGDDLLFLECVRGRPEDVERCRQIVRRTSLEVAVVYSQRAFLLEVELLAYGKVLGVEKDMPFQALVDLLRVRFEHDVERRARRWALSPQQQQIAGYIEQNLSQVEIASVLGVHVGTVRRQVGRILDKLRLNTTEELKIALRFLPDDALASTKQLEKKGSQVSSSDVTG